MILHRKTILVLALLVPFAAARAESAAPPKSGNAVFDSAVQIVLANFYGTKALDGFRDAVTMTVNSLPDLANDDPAVLGDAIDFVLASLKTSHTARFTSDDIDYYELMEVFRYGIRDGVKRLFPDAEVVYPGIGIASEKLGGATFVTDVYDGGPADRAGVLVGDEILSVDGNPFAEVGSFNDKAGGKATLSIRRKAGATPVEIPVPVEWLRPGPTFIKAIGDSAGIVERDGYRLGTIRLWAYTEQDVKGVIEQAIAGELRDADGLVLDLRSRWGGAPAEAADTFVGGAPDMSMIFRGKTEVTHARWRKPIVAIIDAGTRSGMEILAYALKQHGIRLVGTRTATNVVAGRAYMLPDDSLLELAVADVLVDGARLEGVGVTPDIEVPFDIRYAAGSDPQRDAAEAELVRTLSAKTPADGAD